MFNIGSHNKKIKLYSPTVTVNSFGVERRR